MGLDSKDRVWIPTSSELPLKRNFHSYNNIEGILKYFVGFEISVYVSKSKKTK